MTKKQSVAGALFTLTTAGSVQYALAGETHAVNAAPIAPPTGTAPASFADIVQRVAPAVVSIDIEGKAAPRLALSEGAQIDPFSEQRRSPFGDLLRFFQDTPAQPQRLRARGRPAGGQPCGPWTVPW